MAKLTDDINSFTTGDLVFTRYPPTTRQPIHVTLFLDTGDKPGGGFVHAGLTTLEVAELSGYSELGKVSGTIIVEGGRIYRHS